MEDIDGGLHPAVDGQSLDEDDEMSAHSPKLLKCHKPTLCQTIQIAVLHNGLFKRQTDMFHITLSFPCYVTSILDASTKINIA